MIWIVCIVTGRGKVSIEGRKHLGKVIGNGNYLYPYQSKAFAI